MDSPAAARPQMTGLLDTMRDMLEDLGGDLGVTDPVSGTVVANRDLKRPSCRLGVHRSTTNVGLSIKISERGTNHWSALSLRRIISPIREEEP